MLKIYDQNKQYTGYISKYKDLCIERELSTGDRALSFTYCAKGKKKKILNEYYIETQEDWFVVKEIDESSDGYPTYRAELDLEELESYMHQTFKAIDAQLIDAARVAVAGTGWTIETDIDKIRSVATLRATPLTALQKIQDAWMCEMSFDTKKKIVHFREKIGEDKGVYFAQGLNLRKSRRTEDSNDFYTRIIPIGKDGLTIKDINDGKEYLENHQYSTKIRALIWEDTNYEDAEKLKEDAEAKLADLSIPRESYSADVIDLAKKSTRYKLLDYSLGDTIRIMDPATGTNVKQRIVSIKEYPQDPEKNTCELSNTTWSWEEWQSKLEAAAAALENITNSDGTINGVYIKGNIDPNGIVGIETKINESTAIKDIKGDITRIDGSTLGISNDVSGLKEDMSGVKLRIGTIETTYIKATEADLKYATIERADLLEAHIESIDGDYASFKSTITEELVAAKAWMDEASIGDAQIRSLSASKLTAGIIDAKIITVKNLNADNITVGTINGKLIGEGSVGLDRMEEEIPTKKYVDDEISNLITRTEDVEDELGNRVDIETFNRLKQTAEGNSSEISEIRTTAGTLETRTSKLEQDASGLSSIVTDLKSWETTARAEIKQNADAIALKVSKGEVVSEINQSPETIKISADKIDLTGMLTIKGLHDNGLTFIEGGGITAEKLTLKGDSSINLNNIFTVSKTGYMVASNGEIGNFTIDNGLLTVDYQPSNPDEMPAWAYIGTNEQNGLFLRITSRTQNYGDVDVITIGYSGGIEVSNGSGAAIFGYENYPFYVPSAGMYVDYYGNVHAKNVAYTSLSQYSDARMKKNIKTIGKDEMYSVLINARPIKYNMEYEAASQVRYGLVAQEVRDTLIHTGLGYRTMLRIDYEEPNGGQSTDLNTPESQVLYSIDYTQYIAPLISGWQYHEKRIMELRNTVNELSARLESAESQVAELKNWINRNVA